MFPCHVEPVETSSRKAYILLILFATLDPSTALRMTIGWDTHTRFGRINNYQIIRVILSVVEESSVAKNIRLTAGCFGRLNMTYRVGHPHPIGKYR